MSEVGFANSEPTRSVYYQYPASCTLSNWLTAKSVIPIYEDYGTSYRGKITEIKVGSKRRRVFHAFKLTRYKHLSEAPCITLWCNGPNKNVAGKDFNVATWWNAWRNIKDGTRPESYSGTIPVWGPTALENLGENLRDELVVNLFAKSHKPRWDGAVFFAELAETLLSVRDLLLNAAKMAFAKQGASLAWKKVKYISLNSEELWLWYRYFLLPAMMDVEELLRAIKPQAKIDRVQTGKPRTTTSTHGSVFNKGWFNGSFDWEIPWSNHRVISGGCAMDITKRFDPHEWGFSVRDIIRGGYELLPFSFVLDWFWNLGMFLESLRDVEMEIAQSYATFATESTTYLHAGPDTMQDSTPAMYYFLMERIVALDPPTRPTVTSKYNNFIHAIDGISLAAGILKRILSGKRRT